jgi:hypothetical protein
MQTLSWNILRKKVQRYSCKKSDQTEITIHDSSYGNQQASKRIPIYKRVGIAHTNFYDRF